jgi:hypothetical protein
MRAAMYRAHTAYTGITKAGITKARQETTMHLTAHDLVFLIPMALVGVIAMGSIPVTAKFLRISCRTMGALIGALVAVLVLEALPLLI